MIALGPVLGSAMAITATFVPVLRARSSRRAAEAATVAAVPELVDLLRLAVAAGYSVHQMLDLVRTRVPAPFVGAVGEVRRRVGLGARLGDSLDAFDALGEPARPLAAVLRSAAFDGVALAPALDRVAGDARLQRRRAAETAARRLPVQLLVPLVVCILPAFGVLAIVPLLVVSVQSLHL
mgnify:CR=1 FL=1